MNAYPRPCFTPEIIDGMLNWFDALKSNPQHEKVQYIVMASKIDNVFCLGGDLSLFLQLIHSRDELAILEYDIECIKAVFQMHTGIGRDLTTIALVQGDALGGGLELKQRNINPSTEALVQGDALGGGLEGALANDIIIAEKSAKMGLPDILFNLFPGAGAYSFLSRKIGMVEAERMVLGGKLYSAEEMYNLGVVDILVEDGEGEQAVYDYIKKENRQRNGRRAFRKVKKLKEGISFEELCDTAKIWASAAMNIQGRDLRMMERLVKRQSAKLSR